MNVLVIETIEREVILCVHEIARSSFPDAWSLSMLEAELAHPWSYFRVAKWRDPWGQQKDEVVGYSITWVTGDEAHLLNLAIAQKARRRGIARKLMEDVFQIAHQHGAVQIYLEVRATNEGAIHFYKGLGLEQIGRRKRYYTDPPDDALLFVQTLYAPFAGLRGVLQRERDGWDIASAPDEKGWVG